MAVVASRYAVFGDLTPVWIASHSEGQTLLGSFRTAPLLAALSPDAKVELDRAFIAAQKEWHIVRHGLNIKRYPICYATPPLNRCGARFDRALRPAVSMLRRALEGMSEATAAPTQCCPARDRQEQFSRSRVPATKTPKQSAMPVRARLQPSDGIWRKLRSATKRPRSRVRVLI